jgi:hypothetical protein
MAHVFGQNSAIADPSACLFNYRAESTFSFIRLLANASTVEVLPLTALTGTTGSTGVFTFSAHTDGKIYVENRMSGPPRTISLFLVGAPI